MVLDLYNLNERPFGVTPDPRFLYLSPTQREALASVQYRVTAGRGFTALVARPGVGKTTLLFDFLAKTPIPATTRFLFQSQSPRDLLRNLPEGLGVQEESDDQEMRTSASALERLYWHATSGCLRGLREGAFCKLAQKVQPYGESGRNHCSHFSARLGESLVGESLVAVEPGTLEVPLAQAKILGALVNDGTSPIPDSRYRQV